MTINRRTFSTILAGTLAAPRLAVAQTKDRSAFYSGVGGQLAQFDVDFDAATLTKRSSVRLPGGLTARVPGKSAKCGTGKVPIVGLPY
jgi:hypothetical protein